jgi:hypothetical protein
MQAQNCLWAKSAGGTNYDYGNSVSTDNNSNVFMTGSFQSSTITFGVNTLTNTGGSDFFITKYDATGNVLWAKSIGGIGNDISNDVSTDATGNVYITGYFTSPTITFGSTTLTNVDNSVNYNDIFIAKFDSSGNVLWAKSAGGNDNDYGYSISTDASSNVYITGLFGSTAITFGSTTITNTNNTGTSDIFITKYDVSGNVLWARSAGGADSDYGSSVSTDASGNVYMSGNFNSLTITFGSTTLTNADNTGNSQDIFIVKYDAAGNLLWAKSAGGIIFELCNSVSTDTSGNILITGSFDSPTISFGSTILTNANNTGNIPDIFITKYNSAGNVLWAKSAGGTSSDGGSCVSTDASGNIYMSGVFYSPNITFGSTTLTITDTTSYSDIFIAKYDVSGNVLWAKSAGSTYNDKGISVSADTSGNAYITGYFQSAIITFGSTTLTNASSNFADIFIAKYSGTGTELEEMFGNNDLKISPNPANGKFTINLKFKVQSAKLLIVDVYGKEVYTTQINTEITEVDLSGIAKGLYFVNVGDVVKKIVIE